MRFRFEGPVPSTMGRRARSSSSRALIHHDLSVEVHPDAVASPREVTGARWCLVGRTATVPPSSREGSSLPALHGTVHLPSSDRSKGDLSLGTVDPKLKYNIVHGFKAGIVTT